MDDDNYVDLSSDDEENAICISHHFSDDESSSEGEDNENILASYKRKIDNLDLDKDPFEAEMARELDRSVSLIKMRSFSQNAFAPGVSSTKGASSSTEPKDADNQYNRVYFDSDEDEGDEAVKKLRTALSDADLLYDPLQDDKNQKWMDDKMAAKSKGASTSSGKAYKSDAVLNCPACLTMLTADCQRHETYGNQYRAMFVFSCKVDYSQALRYPLKRSKKEIWKSKKRKKGETSSGESSSTKDPPPPLKDLEEVDPNDPAVIQERQMAEMIELVTNDVVAPSLTKKVRYDLSSMALTEEEKQRSYTEESDLYHPVMCIHCNTKVAVIDREEVYHFFNIVTSY